MFWWQEKHSEERKCHGPGLGEESMLPPRMTHTPCCVTRGLVTIKRWPCTAFQAQNKTDALKTLLSGHQPRLSSGAQSVQCRKRPPPAPGQCLVPTLGAWRPAARATLSPGRFPHAQFWSRVRRGMQTLAYLLSFYHFPKVCSQDGRPGEIFLKNGVLL